MKLFYDTWDMNKFYLHVKNGKFGSRSTCRSMVPRWRLSPALSRSTASRAIAPPDHREVPGGLAGGIQGEQESAGGADETLMAPFIMELYTKIFERNPTDSELTENIKQFKLYASKLDRQKAVSKLIESLLLSTEFAYRNEFGEGEPDEHGRRMMSPRNASYALAYALTDASPDETLVQAVKEGRLNSRKDYEREVRRILSRRDLWCIIDENVQAANLNASVTTGRSARCDSLGNSLATQGAGRLQGRLAFRCRTSRASGQSLDR